VTATYGTNDTRSGWTAGGGIEWAFTPNWSAKVEYNHLGFGNQGVLFTGLTGTGAGRLSNVTTDGSIDIIKLGLNYRIGWPFM
jgi:outer membrane immunogenic protein